MTAETVDDGVVMAVEHVELPMSAVQFHPESILTVRARERPPVATGTVTGRARASRRRALLTRARVVTRRAAGA